MGVTIKTEAQLVHMRAAGRVVATVLAEIEQALAPGMTTAEVDQIAERVLALHQVGSPFKHYPNRLFPDKPFPGSVCVSLNEELVHGVPSHERVVLDGDILTVDCGAIVNGWIADSAWTFAIGEIAPETRRLLDVTEQTLYASISVARAGNRTGDIAAIIQQTVEQQGFNVVRELTSHGVGQALHEDPFIYNHGKRGSGRRLRPGMTLALEPMVLMGKPGIYWDADDGWTVRPDDGLPTAHFEHTIVVTEGEPDILTTRC